MWKNNKQLILINTLDDYINDAEGDLDYIKFRLIEFLSTKDFDINSFSLQKKDIYDFLEWYESQKEYLEKVSFIRCKQIINFMFYKKLKD